MDAALCELPSRDVFLRNRQFQQTYFFVLAIASQRIPRKEEEEELVQASLHKPCYYFSVVDPITKEEKFHLVTFFSSNIACSACNV